MNTKQIRIAVAVCSNGHWSADTDADDAWDRFWCECDGKTVHYVNATIPLPESVEVNGEVEST